jgi:hypothetical protein
VRAQKSVLFRTSHPFFCLFVHSRARLSSELASWLGSAALRFVHRRYPRRSRSRVEDRQTCPTRLFSRTAHEVSSSVPFPQSMANVMRGTVARANVGNIVQRTRATLNTRHVGKAYENRMQLAIGTSVFIVFVGIPLSLNQVHKYKVKVSPSLSSRPPAPPPHRPSPRSYVSDAPNSPRRASSCVRARSSPCCNAECTPPCAIVSGASCTVEQ